MMVLIHHYISGRLKPDASLLVEIVNGVTTLCWSGVDLFFVLSGFLIGGILLDQRDSGNYFKTFYIRRICRIFPLYFLWLAMFVLVVHFFASFRQSWQVDALAPAYPLWTYVLFLQNFYIAGREIFGPYWLGTTWSLAIEEQFYLVAPGLVRFIPLQRLPYILVAIVVAVPFFRLYLYMYHPSLFVYVLLPCRADTLLLGVLCAYAVRQVKMVAWLERNRQGLCLALAILFAGLVYFSLPRVAGRDSFEMVFMGYTWLGLFYSCFLLIIVTAKNGVAARLMRLTFLDRLGVIAYGIFLIHLVMDGLVHGLVLGKDVTIHNWEDGGMTVLALFATLLLASISWHFFEKPIVRWGHTFAYGPKKPGSKPGS